MPQNLPGYNLIGGTSDTRMDIKSAILNIWIAPYPCSSASRTCGILNWETTFFLSYGQRNVELMIRWLQGLPPGTEASICYHFVYFFLVITSKKVLHVFASKGSLKRLKLHVANNWSWYIIVKPSLNLNLSSRLHDGHHLISP